MIEIKRINTLDPLYQKERELRNKILLRPIGIEDYGWEMHDARSWHFVAVEDANLIGCALLVPLDDHFTKGQLMQMAVDTDYQGKGVGKEIVKALIRFARRKGIEELEIHSRAEVSPFYETLGFKKYGAVFEEVGVPHHHLSMHLKK